MANTQLFTAAFHAGSAFHAMLLSKALAGMCQHISALLELLSWEQGFREVVKWPPWSKGFFSPSSHLLKKRPWRGMSEVPVKFWQKGWDAM